MIEQVNLNNVRTCGINSPMLKSEKYFQYKIPNNAKICGTKFYRHWQENFTLLDTNPIPSCYYFDREYFLEHQELRSNSEDYKLVVDEGDYTMFLIPNANNYWQCKIIEDSWNLNTDPDDPNSPTFQQVYCPSTNAEISLFSSILAGHPYLASGYAIRPKLWAGQYKNDFLIPFNKKLCADFDMRKVCTEVTCLFSSDGILYNTYYKYESGDENITRIETDNEPVIVADSVQDYTVPIRHGNIRLIVPEDVGLRNHDIWLPQLNDYPNNNWSENDKRLWRLYCYNGQAPNITGIRRMAFTGGAWNNIRFCLFPNHLEPPDYLSPYQYFYDWYYNAFIVPSKKFEITCKKPIYGIFFIIYDPEQVNIENYGDYPTDNSYDGKIVIYTLLLNHTTNDILLDGENPVNKRFKVIFPRMPQQMAKQEISYCFYIGYPTSTFFYPPSNRINGLETMKNFNFCMSELRVSKDNVEGISIELFE